MDFDFWRFVSGFIAIIPQFTIRKFKFFNENKIVSEYTKEKEPFSKIQS